MTYTRHLESLELPHGLTEDVLLDWYTYWQPGGSGPIGAMRVICSLVEEVARIRNIDLPEAKSVKQPSKKSKKGPKTSPNPLNDKIRWVIAQQLGVATDQITNNRTLHDLAADSLDKVEVVMALEDEFEIEITDLEADNLDTMKDYIDLVKEKINPSKTHATYLLPRTDR